MKKDLDPSADFHLQASPEKLRALVTKACDDLDKVTLSSVSAAYGNYKIAHRGIVQLPKAKTLVAVLKPELNTSDLY